MLTPRQHQLLMFLKSFIDERGYPPTMETMADELGLASKSSPFRLLSSLEKRGFIRRYENRHHSIEIIRMPPDCISVTDARRSLEDLVTTYDSGRFPTAEQWAEARLVIGRTERRPRKTRNYRGRHAQ